MPAEPTIAGPIRTLLENYRGLNPCPIDILFEPPTALEFMRSVARNRPFIVRGGAADWPATQLWNADYLVSKMGAANVNVAVTPHGNADSVLEIEQAQANGSKTTRRMYVEPAEREMPFKDVLEYITAQETHDNPGAVLYAQSQNDCLRDEYKELFTDVPRNIDFARIALQQKGPDAVNFWLGNSRSTSALHRDNYENIFVQVRGKKRFLLMPPVAVAVVGEQDCVRARYAIPDEPIQRLGQQDFEVVAADPETVTPIPTWDPDTCPPASEENLRRLIEPSAFTLEEGDMLYLPALWYHRVSQIAGAEGFCCSVNYWYDMNHTGDWWSMNNFVRDAARAAGQELT